MCVEWTHSPELSSDPPSETQLIALLWEYLLVVQ